jgi:hypothetical protein
MTELTLIVGGEPRPRRKREKSLAVQEREALIATARAIHGIARELPAGSPVASDLTVLALQITPRR